MTKYFLLVFLSLSIAACNIRQSDYVNTVAVKQEIKDMKPKRILESDIMEKAYQGGKAVADTFLRLYPEIVCGKQNFDKLDSLKKRLADDIELVCDEYQCKNDIEKQVFEAYTYNLQNNLELSTNLQKIDDKIILFSAPVQKKTEKPVFLFVRLSKKEIIRQNF